MYFNFFLFVSTEAMIKRKQEKQEEKEEKEEEEEEEKKGLTNISNQTETQRYGYIIKEVYSQVVVIYL